MKITMIITDRHLLWGQGDFVWYYGVWLRSKDEKKSSESIFALSKQNVLQEFVLPFSEVEHKLQAVMSV